jgi:polyisoprenoid-binding protein YceI
MNHTHTLLALPLALAVVVTLATSACDKPPAGTAKAVVADAPKPAPAPTPAATDAPTTAPATGAFAAAPAGAAALHFSQVGSSIGFTGYKVTGKHEGGFHTFSGTAYVSPQGPTASRVDVDIDTASVFADAEKLTGHLASPDFFDAQKFPKATFSSSEIKVGGASGATHTITGVLDLHGNKKSITFPATIVSTADAMDVTASFTINRKDFALVYPGKPDDLIRDDVLLTLKIHAAK